MKTSSHRLYRSIKRVADTLLAAAGLVLASPVLLAAACAVRATMGRPILLRQPRAGLRGREFSILKVRTMTEVTDENGRLLPDEERMTRLGSFLRSTSIDELPELVNVLKGEMSLVGPRPLPMAYLPLYSDRQMRRHDVLPGLTGLAQVSGRNSISWEDRLALDVWYAENASLGLDLRIMWRTVAVVGSRKGVSKEGQATMEPFSGAPDKNIDGI